MTAPAVPIVPIVPVAPGQPQAASEPPPRRRASVSERKLEKRIVRLTAQAITDFGMIAEGDKVMVAMSGGKDSYVLLETLRKLQLRAPVHFELLAVHVHQHVPGSPLEELKAWLARSGVPWLIEDQDTHAIIEKLIPSGRNVCSLCARMRRGILYRVALEQGCTKIALGHQMDDAVSTLLLNMFYGGRLKGMPPVLLSSQTDNVVIRPLIYLRERETERWARLRGYPLAHKGLCGAAENRRRQEVKAMMAGWDKEDDSRIYNLFMSMTRVAPSQLCDKALFDFAAAAARVRGHPLPQEAGDEDDI